MYNEIIARLSEDNPKYVGVIKRVFNMLDAAGIDETKLQGMTAAEFEGFFIQQKPKSVRTLRGWIYALRLYGAANNCESLLKELEKIDRLEISRKVQADSDDRKFASFNEYLKFCHDVREGEDYNRDYQTALCMAIFNGIWSSDGSILKNLRRDDVHADTNTVTCRPDNGEPYDLDVEKALIPLLLKASEQTEWERVNYRGSFSNPIYGEFPDSVFKIEKHHDATYKHSYYMKFYKLAKRYAPFPISPRNFYLSGVLHKCHLALSKFGYTLEDSLVSREPIAVKIMNNELQKIHYQFNVSHLKEVVGMFYTDIN